MFANENFTQPNTPFRRVREEEIEIDQKFTDNSFNAKVTFSFRVWCTVTRGVSDPFCASSRSSFGNY